jgi:DNA-binding response OmpR family regulator
MMIGSASAPRLGQDRPVLPSISGLRILVVEDDAGVADLLADMLGDLGHQVVATERTRDAALARAEIVEADLAILDINLGGRPSFPIADRLQARGIPVMFVTGYGILQLTGRYEHATLLKKPFDVAELSATLNGVRRAA